MVKQIVFDDGRSDVEILRPRPLRPSGHTGRSEDPQADAVSRVAATVRIASVLLKGHMQVGL